MGSVCLSLHHDRTRSIFDQFLGSQSFWRVVSDVSVFEPLLEDASSGIGAPPGEKGRFQILPLFWSVVVSIELMDMVFSIDSILASLAISPNPVIVLIGGLIGILCMRGIAEVVMRLMEILPELEVTAYILIALIAVKLFLTIPMINIEIPAALFGGIVLASLAVTVVVHKIRN